MMTRTLLLGGLAAGLTLAVGCKKKVEAKPEVLADAGGAAAGAAGAGAAGAPGSTAPGAPATAAGDAVGDLPVVTECPKSLAGNEKVARTIKKECGPIVVTGPYGVDGTLTLEAGVVLKFKEGATLDVGYYGPAKLLVKGTAKEPVLFTSGGDQAPGVWAGVRLHDGADRSSIEGLVIEWAGDADHGALFVGAEDVTFTGSTIRNAKEVGLRGDDKARFAAFTGNSFDKSGKIAVSVAPATVGSLGAGNTLPADAFIEVRQGSVDTDAKWVDVGAPFHVVGDVNVDGKNGRATLEIAAGTRLRFASGTELAIGYYAPGGIKIAGSQAKPVELSGIEKKPDGWTGLRVYDSGEGTIEHASFESGGSDDDRGALAVTHGYLTVKDSSFRNNKLGLSADKDARKLSADGLVFEGNGTAVLLTAESFAGLGAGNKYGDKQTIELRGGSVATDATWNLQPGAQVVVSEDLAVDKAILRVAAGSQFAAKEGVEWGIGYYGEASIKLNGTPDKPIKMRGVRDEKDSWDGLRVYDQARDAVIENVQLENVAGEAGLKVKGRARAKVSKLSCSGCAATLAWECESKVESEAITGKSVAPTGCQ